MFICIITKQCRAGADTTKIEKIEGSITKFYSADGVELNAFMNRPRGVPSCKGLAVLHVHGLTGNFFSSTGITEISKRLADSGITFMSIETRGSYIVESFKKGRGKRHSEQVRGSAFERFEESVYDIDGAVRFLRRAGFRRIILSGHSSGCQKAAYYAYKKKCKNVSGIVLMSPVDDYDYDSSYFGKRHAEIVQLAKRIKARHGYDALMPRKFANDTPLISAGRFLSTNDLRNPEARMFNYKGRLEEFSKITCPVLAIFGTKDHYEKMDVRKCLKKLSDASSSSSISTRTIKGAAHNFQGKRDALALLISAWIKKEFCREKRLMH